LPGFLSEYEGTERVELGGGYWVEIKKCLSRTEYQKVQDLLGGGRQTVNMSGTRLMQMDVGASQEEMLFQSVTDWNLDDEAGVKWPLAPEKDKRANIRRLPASAFLTVFQACDELNGPRAGKEAAQFPEGAERGAEDGDDSPAGP
jgi:hypothetical protein